MSNFKGIEQLKSLASKAKMPTPKDYPGSGIGDRFARSALSTDRNYSNMGDRFGSSQSSGVTTGRNNPRGAKGAR